jgi:hypothetical protein
MRALNLGVLLLILAPTTDHHIIQPSAAFVIVPEPALQKPKPPVGLQGKRFRSVLDHESGLMPTGVIARGPWHLEFTAAGFTWTFSDLCTGGGYRYDAATGDIQTLWFSQDVAARYDLATGLLEWDGKLYREVVEE